MDAAGVAREGSTGMFRLLEHCEALDRVTTGAGVDARSRLETQIGCELARRLVGALTRGGRTRSPLLV